MIGCGRSPVAGVSKDVRACRQHHVKFGPVLMCASGSGATAYCLACTIGVRRGDCDPVACHA